MSCLRRLAALLVLGGIVGFMSPEPITRAASMRDVVISEVAWMGTQASANDEWIELYNNTDHDIDLTGWKLQAEDGTPTITLSGTIRAHGFFLLERTDDNTVKDIAADLIYGNDGSSWALSNSGEKLLLKDPNSIVIDTANGDGGPWPAGSSSPKATMERIDLTVPDSDSTWDTNDGVHRNGLDANDNPINGTPKAPRQRASYNMRDVVISEIAWMGTQADSNDEWLELYNNTDQAISLVGWRLEAADGVPSIALSGTIPAQGFFLLERTDDNTVSDIPADQIYTGALSNSGEALVLRDPSGNIIDTANGDGGPWPAGNDSPQATMERIDLLAPDSDTNWATNNGIYRNGLDAHNNPINGTPKAHKPPYVSITNPTSASPSYVHQGASITVSFTTDEAGLYEITLDSVTCGTGSASVGSQNILCTLPESFPEGAQNLTVTVTDFTNTAGSSSEPEAVIVDNTPPNVTVLAPNGGEVLSANTLFTIRWSCTDAHLGPMPIELLYSTDDGLTFPHSITAATENDGAFEWVVPILDTPAARVRAQCTDLAYNSTSDDSDGSFTIRPVSLGDVNADGRVNVIDARMAQQHADGFITLTGTPLWAADVDQDHDVDAADAEAIAKKGIGLPTGIPGFSLGLLSVLLISPVLARWSRKLAMLLLVVGLGALTGCVEFAGLPPPPGPAVFLTSTAMPNGATRTLEIVVQQITSGGGVASLQGRLTFPYTVTVHSITGLNGFIVKASSQAPGEARFSLVKPTPGGVSSGPVARLVVSVSGRRGAVYTLRWAASAQTPIVVGGETNTEIPGLSFGDGQVKVR